MDNSSNSSSFWPTVLIYVAIVGAIIFTGVVLAIVPESAKGSCLAAVGIMIAVVLGVASFAKKWPAAILSLFALLFVVGAAIWYVAHPAQVPPDPPPEIIEVSPAPSESLELPVVDNSITPVEIAPTEDGIGILTTDEMEEKLTAEEADYFPGLEMQDYRHLFFSFTEEFPEDESIDILEYQSLILEHSEAWSIEKLKSFINLKFQDSYQKVEDFPAKKANESPEIATLNQRIEKLETDIKLARATNEPVLPLYDQLADCYREVIGIAPRGEYYIQLARPYEEGILRMRRVTPREKNAVFLRAANAVAYFWTALTYEAPVGDSVSDILYRVAKIYHYAGDTSGLYPEIRSYCYRVSVAYMELAAEQETPNDTYYGYSTYYGAMVYHKLAIITTERKEKMDYLELAEQNYEKADKEYPLDSSAKNEIKHALLDIAGRK